MLSRGSIVGMFGAIRAVPASSSVSNLFFFLLLPLLVVGAFVWWFFEPTTDRVVRMRQSGMSQRAIAERNGITVYKVRRILASC